MDFREWPGSWLPLKSISFFYYQSQTIGLTQEGIPMLECYYSEVIY